MCVQLLFTLLLQMDEDGFLEVPQLLNPENYWIWKCRFEVFVQGKSIHLWRIIEVGDYIPPINLSENDKIKVHENYIAIYLLYCSLPDNEFKFIYRCDTAHEIWKTLEMVHEGNSEVKDSKVLLLTKELETFKMFKGESVCRMSLRIKGIKNELLALEKTYPDEVYVRSVINGLPSKLNPMANILRCKDLSVLSLEDVIGRLRVFEMDQERFDSMSMSRVS